MTHSLQSGKEATVPKTAGGGLLISDHKKVCMTHIDTHINTHKGQSGTQGHVMLEFMSGTEVGVTHSPKRHTPSWKTPREHMRTAGDGSCGAFLRQTF